MSNILKLVCTCPSLRSLRDGGLMVRALVLDFGSSGPGFEPWPRSLHCAFGQDTLLSQCLSPPRWGYQDPVRATCQNAGGRGRVLATLYLCRVRENDIQSLCAQKTKINNSWPLDFGPLRLWTILQGQFHQFHFRNPLSFKSNSFPYERYGCVPGLNLKQS